jgi:PAS domain S-box-containing protein
LRAEETLQQHLSFVQSGLVSLDNLIQFHQYLILHHRQEPFISALSIGTAKGEFRSSIRASTDTLQQFPLQPEETLYRAIITHGKEPGLDRVYAIAQNGQLGRYLFSVKSHDVRHRPWYRRAAETREIGWTEPYPIGSSSGLGMSVSIPIYGFKSASSWNQPVDSSPNNPVAVLSNTISLDSLSGYLHAIAGKRVIYIIDSQGLMIANSLQKPVTHVRKQSIHQRDGRIPALVRRLSVQDMESPTLTQSNQEMKQLIPNWQNLQISSTLTVNINQQRQFLSIFPNRSHGRQWFVVVITPEAELVPPRGTDSWWIGVVAVLNLAFMVGMVWFLSQQVVKKVSQIQQGLGAIANGQLDYRINPNQAIQELEQITQSIKILQETQDELKALIDNSPLAVIFWDQEFRVRKWSRQAEELFGWAEPEVLGKKFTDWQFLVEDEIPQTMEYLKRLELGEGVICQNHNYRKDGTLLCCEWFNSAIKDESGGVVTVLSMAQDISALEQVQQALGAAKELAEAANQSKSTFLANFSHEFRTPLHIILGYVQQIQKHPTCNQLFNLELKAIYTQGTYLFNLFQDLLELSKAESGRQTVNLTSCPLIELLSSLHSIFVNRAAAKGLILQIEYEQLPAYVSVDGSKLQQVLINLLTNAIKCTHQGQIVLKVNHQTHQASNTPRLNFQLTDTGVGIAPEDISGLFEPFVQGKVGRHQGGSGLGLAICQRLIRLMGGDITITSQVGIGTTVGFYLPIGIIPKNGSVEINSDFSQSGLTGLIDCSEQQFMEITPSIDWNSLRSQLGYFPSPWLEELYRLAMRGSDDKILLLVNPVTHEYPELSSWLIQMAQNYDFDGILNLVQPLVNNS